MIWFLAGVLVLHPFLPEDGNLRLVSVGTEGDEVVWYLDGHEAARTRDGEAAAVAAAQGEHELHAVTAHEGEWQALARLDPATAGITYVPAWHARHVPQQPMREPVAAAWALPVAMALAALAAAAWPRRSKGP